MMMMKVKVRVLQIVKFYQGFLYFFIPTVIFHLNHFLTTKYKSLHTIQINLPPPPLDKLLHDPCLHSSRVTGHGVVHCHRNISCLLSKSFSVFTLIYHFLVLYLQFTIDFLDQRALFNRKKPEFLELYS